MSYARRASKISSTVDDAASRRKSRLVSATPLSYIGRSSLAWRSSGKGGFKVPKYQNSYRLEPYLPFRCEVSDKILTQVMTNSLEDIRYNTETCAALCRNIAADIRDQLYKTDYDRVKYVVMVSIIENTGQSIISVNGRLWDTERDTYSIFVFESPTVYATGIVMTLYYE